MMFISLWRPKWFHISPFSLSLFVTIHSLSFFGFSAPIFLVSLLHSLLLLSFPSPFLSIPLSHSSFALISYAAPVVVRSFYFTCIWLTGSGPCGRQCRSMSCHVMGFHHWLWWTLSCLDWHGFTVRLWSGNVPSYTGDGLQIILPPDGDAAL